jgi:hypothetical protein
MSELGGFCAPFLMTNKSGLLGTAIAFAAFNIIAAVVCLFLPETSGIILVANIL